MLPTGSGTSDRFNAPGDLPENVGLPAVRQLRRAVEMLAVGLAVLLPASANAQGPIQPASYGHSGGGWSGPPMVSGPQGPYGHGYPACETGTGGFCQDTYYELLPDDRFGCRNEEFCAALSDAFQYAYFRVEYLNWNIDDPGRQIVGAPREFGDERELFNAVDPASQTIVGLAEVTTYDAVGLSHNNGVRGVFGLPTRIGTFEAGVSVLEQAGVHIFNPPYVDFTTVNNVFPAIPLLNDGVPDDNTMILFSEGMNVQIRSEFFSTEANFIMHPLTPNQPMRVQPLWGFQYVRFWDNVDIFGQDIDTGDPDDPDDDIVLNHRIYSDAKNNIFAPQVGVQFQFDHEWFSLGVTPKFMLGFNRHHDEVFSEQIFSPTEGRLTTREETSEFAPGLDLAVYGKVHLGKHLSLFVSYQLYYFDNISRATDNVRYDTIGGNQSNIVLSPHQEGMFIDGVTVGGEFRFH